MDRAGLAGSAPLRYRFLVPHTPAGISPSIILFWRRRSADVLVHVGLADPLLIPGRLLLAGRRVSGGMLVVELAEGREGPRAVDRGRAAVHQERDPDRLGGFLRGGAALDRGVGMGGDTAIAFLADRDGQSDELLGPGIQGPGRQCGIVQFPIARVDLGDRVPQLSRRYP